MFLAVVVGVVLGQVASRITQYYTSSKFKPVRDIADSGKTGPATVILSGISSGMESAVWAVVAVGIAILAALGLGGGNALFAFYLVALVGIGMLSTTAIVVAEDTFGPIADNAQGIAEMSDEFHGETETILDGLDTVGNTTKAVTKGFAIGSAVIAAVALFASFRETIAAELGVNFNAIAINIADPEDVRRRPRRRHRRVPVLLARDPRRQPHRRNGGAGGPAPVPGEARDHGLHRRSPTTGRSSTSAPEPHCAS